MKWQKLALAELPVNEQRDTKDSSDDEDDEFLPDSAEADEDGAELSNLSPAVRALMRKYAFRLASSPDLLCSFVFAPSWINTDGSFVEIKQNKIEFRLQNGNTPNQEAEPVCTKIYYASRTHSQLSQVLHELRKLKFHVYSASSSSSEAIAGPSSITRPHQHTSLNQVVPEKRQRRDNTDEDEGESPGDGNERGEMVMIRTVSLGSRKQLCINEPLKERVGDLDEACRQMLSGRSLISHRDVFILDYCG